MRGWGPGAPEGTPAFEEWREEKALNQRGGRAGSWRLRQPRLQGRRKVPPDLLYDLLEAGDLLQ